MFSRVKKAFLAEYFNEQENERYNLARHNFGTKVATFMAAYNLLLIRQRVLKNAIHFTKSNNPLIVKMASIGVGAVYFAGLFCIWMIPSIAVEGAVRTYYGMETATMAYLISGEEIASRVFNAERRKDLMRRENISAPPL